MPEQAPKARAQALIRSLGLRPHPEGGWYNEVFRSERLVQPADSRPPRRGLTTIDFLLEPGQFSAWHRVQSDEVWHLLEGPSLRLWLAPPELSVFSHVDLGPVATGRRPRHVVPAGWWQTATSLGAWTLVGCTVAPGFDFSGFELAPPDWRPTPRAS